MFQESEQTLLLVLKDELKIVLASCCPEKSFMIDDICYFDLGWGDFIGFFDWLRNKEEQIIGVRINTWAEFDIPYKKFEKLKYVSIDTQMKISFYFSDDKLIQESISGDQDFRSNRVYKSVDGNYAISFRMPEVLNSFSPKVSSKFKSLNC